MSRGGSIACKGAYSTLQWTSSKPQVATVNSKGEVTAIAEGTATITAKALDGSGKSATYKVTIKDPIFLTNFRILNEQSVTFSLNKAFPLDVSKVVVMKKAFSNGSYKNQLTIDSLSTTDNVTYTVVLGFQSMIRETEYVQINIPSLTGA